MNTPQPLPVERNPNYKLASDIYELIMDERAGVLARSRHMDIDREHSRIICKQQIAELLNKAQPRDARALEVVEALEMTTKTLQALIDGNCLKASGMKRQPWLGDAGEDGSMIYTAPMCPKDALECGLEALATARQYINEMKG